MANVVITLRVMPDSPDVDLKKLEKDVIELITKFSGEEEFRVKEEPIAFGLKALDITFVMDEKIGGTEELEKQISEIQEVNSAEVKDVRRAVG
jgi:elongation factor 1-beta